MGRGPGERGARRLLLLLMLLLLLLVHGPPTTRAFKIIGKLSPVSVAEGGVVVLHCNYSQHPEYSFWRYQQASVGGESYEQVSLCSAAGCTLQGKFAGYGELLAPANGSLVIRGAQRRNDGVYKCYALYKGNSAFDKARMTVLVPPGSPLLTANASAPLVDSVLALACNSTGGNPEPSLRWRWLLSDGRARPGLAPQVTAADAVFGSTVSRLAVRLSATDHLSTVRCEAANSAGNVSSRVFELRVHKPPGRPAITASNLQPRAGSTLVLVCSSDGGNPAPSLSWTWTRASGRSRELPAPAVTQPDRPFGRAESRLELTVDHLDHRALVRCSARNSVRSVGPTSKTLDVIYKPRLEAFPFSPYAVLEGRRLIVDCRASGNPEPRVTWTKEGKQVLDVSKTALSFTKLFRSHHGLYTCTAENDVGVSSLQLELRVLYPPSVSVPTTLVVPEGQNAVLSCRVRASPPADVSWQGPDGRLVGVAGPDIRLESVSRRHAGRYECVAQNRLEPSEGSPSSHTARNGTDLVVKYLPSEPTIVLTPSSSVVKGTDVSFACSANDKDPGYPYPRLEWRRLADNAVLSTNGSLRIPSARLADSGRYRCTPRNSLGSGPVREVPLQVEQPPEFVQALDPPTRTLRLSPFDLDFSVYCTVRGKPLPEIKWTRDAAPITGSGDLAVFFRVSSSERAIGGDPRLGFEVKSILAWRGARRGGERQTALRPDDNGNYACEASNSRGRIRSGMALVVQYAPQFVAPARKVAADLRLGVATLNCPVTAQPPPDDTAWFLPDGRRVGGPGVDSRFAVRTEPQPSRRLFTTVLTIRALRTADLRLYRCHARNAEGNNSLTVELRNQSRPEVPTEVRVRSSTWESALLAWQPGFDGGFAQVFELTVEWADRDDMRKGLSGRGYNLTNLLPNTTYGVTLRGVNRLGKGPASRRVHFHTDALYIPKIQNVRLDVAQKRISFSAPDGYCVRVDVSRDRGRTWLPFRDCVRPSADAERVTATNEEYRAALCLQRRRDVCSEFERAVVNEAGPEVPLVVILAVAVACAVLIVVLVAILIFFCMRRRPRRKEFDANPAHRRPQAVTINPYAPTPPSTGPAVHHSPPGKPYAMVIPTSGTARRQPAPAYENGAASFGGDDADCGRSRGRASPWDAKEKRVASPAPPPGSTFGVTLGPAPGDGQSVLSPPSNSSQDPLLSTGAASPDPPPYTDTLRRPGPPAGTQTRADGFELQPMGGADGTFASWGQEPANARSASALPTCPSPSSGPTLGLPAASTCPRQPKKVIYEVVV